MEKEENKSNSDVPPSITDLPQHQDFVFDTMYITSKFDSGNLAGAE